jgi:UDP-glucose:(heptosyl)LPS alpha-1,3-glucosyltransferase
MKLAFCIFKYYPFGGLERNFLRITEECIKRGHEITIYTMKWDGEVPGFIGNSNCRIEKVPFRGATNHSRCFFYHKNLSRILSSESYDLILGFNRMPGLDLYYCADVCFKADIRKRHSFLYRFTPRYRVYSEFEEAVFGKESDTKILILSHIQREIYSKVYGTSEDRFFPVPAGLEKERLRSTASPEARSENRAKMGLKEDDNMLIMVGSDFRRKGVIRSIKAVAELPAPLDKKTKLFVIGKGKQDVLEKTARDLGIGDNVVFTGAVNDVENYLSAADLLLHPAVSENTGNAIGEALISGTPVIATSNCGYAFHVEEADAGKVVDGDQYSQEEMNKALKDLLEKLPDKREEWKKNAIAYTDKTDFYSRPQTVADIIEKLQA